MFIKMFMFMQPYMDADDGANLGGGDPLPDPNLDPKPELENPPVDNPEEYDEVDYNHEKVKIPASERKTYIQKGLNYDKVKTQADKHYEALTKAAKVQGFDTVESYLQAVEEAETNAQRQRYEQAGITNPELIEEMINKHPAVQQAAKQQREIEMINQKKELQDKPFFKELESDIDNLVRNTPGVDVNTAYIFLRGEKFEELMAKKASETAEEALQNHKRQAKRGVEPSDDVPITNKKLDFTADERAWAERGIKRGTYKNLEEAHKWLRNKI